MSFVLSRGSLGNLEGVYPPIAFLVTEAIKITKIDFMVFDGVRSYEEQVELKNAGDTWTLDGYHLYGLAVDLVPLVNRRLVFEHDPCVKVAEAMADVSSTHGVPVDWGYDLWGKDSFHFQCTGLKPVYDIRKLAHTIPCVS